MYQDVSFPGVEPRLFWAFSPSPLSQTNFPYVTQLSLKRLSYCSKDLLKYRYLDKGESQNAVDYFEELIKEYPKSAEVWNGKGEALIELGKGEEALQCFDISIRLDWNNAKTWINKGVSLH